MKIVVFETMPGEKEALTAHVQGHTLEFREEKLGPDTVAFAQGAAAISVFVKSEVTPAVIDMLPDLRLITTRSMGYDHIDVAYAKTKGIKVGNVTTYASHPVAEFAFALLLSLVRRIYPAYNRLREGTQFDTRDLGGFNLFGKTIGVLGTGRIGRSVIPIALGFGMKVLAFDVKPDEAFAKESGFTYAPLEDLLKTADIITVHMPSVKETRHFIDAAAFAKMKKGVVFINTARGDIVDTHALVAALSDGTVWGAGLDVLEDERALKDEVAAMTSDKEGVDYELLAANHILIDMPNVVITPHIAFETKEAMEEIARVTAQTLTAFAEGSEQTYL